METISKAIKRWSFEYWYLIVMVIYASKVTNDTSRMNYGLSGNPVPFLIPIVLTIILLYRNKVSFKNRQLSQLLGVSLLWIFLITIKYSAFETGFQSYNFFLIYAILIAYVHIKVYGKSFSTIYEDIMVRFSIISLVLWLFGYLLPGPAATFFHLFPSVEAITGGGNHLFYLYNWFDPAFSSGQGFVNIPRNSGCCFEPGYFASMLCIAVLCNCFRNGLKIKNKNFLILSVALLTTFSTTGYLVYLVILATFYIKSFSFASVLKICFIVVPLSIYVMNFDFVGEKILQKSNLKEENHRFHSAESYHAKQGNADFRSALDRIQSLYFESQNILEDPILGYSRDVSKSWFGQTFLSNYSLTGGLLKTIGQFGLILGMLWYALLFRSSKVLSNGSNFKRTYILAAVMLMISVSYGYFGTPIFMTFWLLGVFGKPKEVLFLQNERNR